MFGLLFGQTQSERMLGVFLEPCAKRRAPRPARAIPSEPAPAPAVAPSASLTPASRRQRYVWDDGEKFPGGFGAVDYLLPDYYTLRQRSAVLHETNLYARGAIRRLVTNEINSGLHLEALPSERVLGLEEGELADWSEYVEDFFEIWANDPRLCDVQEQRTFGEIQEASRIEALVCGDVLWQIIVDPRTGLPRIQLHPAASVVTPFGERPRNGNTILHGVEVDPLRRHVAYWVRQDDGSTKRVPKYGEKSGRRIAWLVYGTDKRYAEVRGKPILALVLQALKDVDDYRDATVRKAKVASYFVGWVEKTEAKRGSDAFAAAAMRRMETTLDETGVERSFEVAEYVPGVFVQELQHGEKVHFAGSQGVDEKFGDFEAAIVQGFAWGLEVPPEIMRLSFNSNYAASQGANNEFKNLLNKLRARTGSHVCQPVYEEWIVSQALKGRIDAAGLVAAWRTPADREMFAAWVRSDWSGQVKPSTDVLKTAKAYAIMINTGLITRDRASREVSGMKWTRIHKQLLIENRQKAESDAPLVKAPAAPQQDDAKDPDDDGLEDDEREDEEEDREDEDEQQ